VCNPLTSAACLGHVAAGTGVGTLIPGVGPVVGALAGGGAARAVVGGATNAALGGLAGAIQAAIGTIARDMVTWWISLPSPDLAADPVPRTLQAWLYPFTAAVAIAALITAAARMALTRKSAPLADAGSGLLTVAITTAAGTLLPTLLLRAGDAYSNAVLESATNGQFASRFAKLIAFAAVNGPGSAAILLVIGMIALILAAFQAVLLLFRQVSVIILAGTLPLAAAGTMTPLTRPWFRRVTGWELALIFYKPAAATVYGAGFLLIGQGNTVLDVLGGLAVLGLSLVALPVLLRFFNWAPGALESGGGSGVLSSVIGGAAAIGALKGYGSGGSAADQARAMSMTATPGSGPAASRGSHGGPGTGGPAGGAPPGSGSGPGTSAGAEQAGSAAAAGAGQAGAAGTATGAASTGAGAGAARAAPAASGAGAATGAATAAAGPAGVILLGVQAAAGAATRLAEGAAPPGDRP